MATSARAPRIFRPVGRPSMEQITMEATLFSCAVDYQSWQQINNRIATGKSINSWVVRIKKTTNNLILVGSLGAVAYIDFVLFGRGPGTPPPVQDIFTWLRIKNITSASKSDRQLAFAIAKSIGNNGTLQPHLSTTIITRMVSVNTKTVLRKSNRAYLDEKSAEFMLQLEQQYALEILKSKRVQFKVVTGATKVRNIPMKNFVDTRFDL